MTPCLGAAPRRAERPRHRGEGPDAGYVDGRVPPAHAILLLVCVSVQVDLDAQTDIWLGQVHPDPDDIAGVFALEFWRGALALFTGRPNEAETILTPILDRWAATDLPSAPVWVDPFVLAVEAMSNLAGAYFGRADRTALRGVVERLDALEPPGGHRPGAERIAHVGHYYEAILDGDWSSAHHHLREQERRLLPDPVSYFHLDIWIRAALTFLEAGDPLGAHETLVERLDAFTDGAAPSWLEQYVALLSGALAPSHPAAFARAQGCRSMYLELTGVTASALHARHTARMEASAREAIGAPAWDEAFAVGRGQEMVALCHDLAGLTPA